MLVCNNQVSVDVLLLYIPFAVLVMIVYNQLQPQLETIMSGMVMTSRLLIVSSMPPHSISSSGTFLTKSSIAERWEGEQHDPSTTESGFKPNLYRTKAAEVVNILGPTVTGSHKPSQ